MKVLTQKQIGRLMGFIILSFSVLQGAIASDAFSNDLTANKSMYLFEDLKRADGSSIFYYLQTTGLEEASDMKAEVSTTLLVLIQGSGCTPVLDQSQTMRDMAKVMSGADILWVEKRGLDVNLSEKMVLENCPESYYQYESLHQRVEDYKAVITSLADQYEKIVILGGSEGAIIVGLLLQEDFPIVAAVALNGGGQYFIDDVLWNITKTVPKPDCALALAGIQSFAAYILAMTTEELALDQDYSSNHSVRWWHDMLSLNMLDVWKNVGVPLLMIQTLGDNNVSVLSAKAMFEVLERSPQIKVMTMPALDHGFNDLNGQSKTQDVIREIQDWLKTALK